ncbi:uncharacterized protein LOC123641923 [Lemur catta]|uniref:uncharacterized protein LOC123641923 n=1 Tax=Lemur catta TaxID=9447 RepID=UPI001E26DDEA|nr:uncharacterized protein LOC123641923 [Lemur catta]
MPFPQTREEPGGKAQMNLRPVGQRHLPQQSQNCLLRSPWKQPGYMPAQSWVQQSHEAPPLGPQPASAPDLTLRDPGTAKQSRGLVPGSLRRPLGVRPRLSLCL